MRMFSNFAPKTKMSTKPTCAICKLLWSNLLALMFQRSEKHYFFSVVKKLQMLPTQCVALPYELSAKTYLLGRLGLLGALGL